MRNKLVSCGIAVVGLLLGFFSCSGNPGGVAELGDVSVPEELQLMRYFSTETRLEQIPKTPWWRLGEVQIASQLPQSVTPTWRYAYQKHRWSIAVHAPTTLTFPPMQVGKNAVLRFGYYLAPSALARGSDGVTFRVWCVNESRENSRECIFEDTCLVGSAWKPAGVQTKEIPLPVEYGETIRLQFETDPGPGGNRRSDNCNWEMPVVRWEKQIKRNAPNVILFTLDTLRADHLHCYGYDVETSPEIDTLAEGGTLMTEAYSQCTATVPSHMSIMTGLHLKGFGVYEQAQEKLPSRFDTLAERLNGAGYATAGFIAAGFMRNDWINLGQGFDTFLEFPPALDGPVWRVDGEYVVNPAINWLAKHYGQPFFMWVHLFDCHAHYDAPDPFKKQFVDPDTNYTPDVDRSMIPKWGGDMVTPLNKAYYTARYDGSVAYTDHQVGRIVSVLKKLGVFNKTLIVIAADHGESLGEHDMYFNHLNLYEQNVHVPLIFHLPAKIAKGKRVSDLCENVDIYPTVLDLAGVEAPDGLDGQSLVPVWGGRGTKREGVVAEHAFHAAVSWRTEDWTYLYHPMAAAENRKLLEEKWRQKQMTRWRDGQLGIWMKRSLKEELYDRNKDPEEINELSAYNAGTVENLRFEAKEWVDNCDSAWADRMFSATRTIEPEKAKIFGGLGYVE
ncbi:MAG: sulfatase [bacterium]